MKNDNNEFSTVLKFMKMIPFGIVLTEAVLIILDKPLHWIEQVTGYGIRLMFQSFDEITGMITFLFVGSLYLVLPVFIAGILQITNKKYVKGIFHLAAPTVIISAIDFENLDGLI